MTVRCGVSLDSETWGAIRAYLDLVCIAYAPLDCVVVDCTVFLFGHLAATSVVDFDPT